MIEFTLAKVYPCENHYCAIDPHFLARFQMQLEPSIFIYCNPPTYAPLAHEHPIRCRQTLADMHCTPAEQLVTKKQACCM